MGVVHKVGHVILWYTRYTVLVLSLALYVNTYLSVLVEACYVMGAQYFVRLQTLGPLPHSKTDDEENQTCSSMNNIMPTE